MFRENRMARTDECLDPARRHRLYSNGPTAGGRGSGAQAFIDRKTNGLEVMGDAVYRTGTKDTLEIQRHHKFGKGHQENCGVPCLQESFLGDRIAKKEEKGGRSKSLAVHGKEQKGGAERRRQTKKGGWDKEKRKARESLPIEMTRCFNHKKKWWGEAKGRIEGGWGKEKYPQIVVLRGGGKFFR